MTYFEQFKKQPYPDNDGGTHNIYFKDCPFCGDSPYVTPRGSIRTKKRAVIVKCKTCRIERTDAALRYGWDWLYNIAAENWNNRVIKNEQATEARKY